MEGRTAQKGEIEMISPLYFGLFQRPDAGKHQLGGNAGQDSHRNRAEQKIRQYLVSNNYVDTVIQLPQNLFFGTSIATCIIVLKKNKPDNRVCFIDASNEFVHEGNKNKLSAENIDKIYETQFNKTEIEYFSKVVTTTDIEAQKYNLSVSTYVEKEDTSVEVDIEELNQRIAQIVSRQNVLRTEIDELVKTL